MLNQQINALGNKLKLLRKEHGLSTPVLADQLDCSAAFINLLESGKRGASDGTLQKYCSFFGVKINDLKELQSQTVSISYNDSTDDDIPNEVLDYISLILKIKEPHRSIYIEEAKAKLQSIFYSLLTPFDLSEVKKIFTGIKSKWYSLEENDLEVEITTLNGMLQIPEKQLYFKLQISKDSFSLDLLFNDNRNLDLFSKWIGEPNVTFVHFDDVPHLNEKQKLKKHTWFSPSIAVRDQLYYLKNSNLINDTTFTPDPQLNMLIKYYLESYVKEVS